MSELLLRRRTRFSKQFQTWLDLPKESRGPMPMPIRTRRVQRIEAEITAIMQDVMPQFEPRDTYFVVDLWAEEKGVRWDGTPMTEVAQP